MEVKRLHEMEVFCYWFECPKCGCQEIMRGFNFCPECGVDITFPKRMVGEY